MLVSFIYLFGVLRRFQHCTGHITTVSWKGIRNQYIQLVKVLYCKLLTNGKQLPAFPLEAVPGSEPRPQRWEVRVLPLCHHGPLYVGFKSKTVDTLTYSTHKYPNAVNVVANVWKTNPLVDCVKINLNDSNYKNIIIKQLSIG